MIKPRRVTLFAGHYGSGKTNIAVNYALYLRSLGVEVSIGDLDVVNPYFRTKDSEEELINAGVKVISLPFANSSVDLPSLPAEAYSLVQDKSRYAVLDIGGDDRGAYALGRYRPYILEENDYDMLFVTNFFRPLTRTASEAYEVLREIEEACRIKFTGIVNNTNLGEETTPEMILSSLSEIDKLCEMTGLPVVMTTVKGSLEEAVTSASASAADSVGTVFPMILQEKI